VSQLLRLLIRFTDRWGWAVAAVGAVVALVLGYAGFTRYYVEHDMVRDPLHVFYVVVQLFVLESGAVEPPVPWELEAARLLAPAATAYAVAVAVLHVFSEGLVGWRLRTLSRHVILCGLGPKGTSLVEALCHRGERLVVIDRGAAAEDLAHCRELGAIALEGTGSDRWLLRKARASLARAIIATDPADGANVETAIVARDLSADRRSGTLQCVVQVFDTALQRMLKQMNVLDSSEKTFRAELFNVYEIAARVMLREPVPFDAEVPPGQPARIVIVGLGRLGEAVLVRAARDWRIDHGPAAEKLRAVVVDENAAEKASRVLARHPFVAQHCDVEPTRADVRAAAFTAGGLLGGPDECGVVHAVLVCLGDESNAALAALAARKSLADSDVPIVVRMAQRRGLASLLDAHARDGRPGSPRGNIRCVGLLDMTCTPDLVLGGAREVIAQAIHQGYLRAEHAKGTDPATNPSMVLWEDLPESLKESNRRQADDIDDKLRSVGCEMFPMDEGDFALFAFSEDELEMLARREHDRWCHERRAAGWRPGPKDVERKRTPHLVPWEDLSEEFRDYDRRAVALIPVVLAKADFGVRRVEPK
jgi:hypothetical protein